MKVFVDTGGFCALAIPDDRWHECALHILENLRTKNATITTSNFVLVELYTLLNARAGHRTAISFMDRLESSDTNVIRVTEEIEGESRIIFRKYDLPRLSFTDCTSFALINTQRISHIFTFDQHFRIFRFKHHVTVLGEP